MKRLFLGVFFCLLGSLATAGPMVEVYNCTLNDGKTYQDLNKMMNTFSSMMKKAGLEDSYQAHVGFQQLPIKKNSVNWIGISPSAGDYGKAIEWFTGTEDGMAFGELYQSVYSCDTSFMTFITASSN